MSSMPWTRTLKGAGLVLLLFLGGLVLPGGPGAVADEAPRGVAAADDDALEAKAQLASRLLDALRVRLEARLGQAETLRTLGRLEEALKAFQSVDEIHEEGLQRIEAFLDRLEADAGPARDRPQFVASDEAGEGLSDAPFDGPAQLEAEPAQGPGGAFRGRGGSRDPGRTGASRAMEGAVDSALKWLTAHQSPNGAWEAAGFHQFCDGKPALQGPDGVGKPLYDTGVTGLALCAFLGAGYTNRGRHPFAKTVSKGLRYLKNVQDVEGCFGPRTSQHFIYNHACAALAMVEAYGMTQSPIFKGSAQKALDFIALTRNPYFAWRYGVKPGDNDTSVSGWMLMALKSAQLINADAVRHGRPAPLPIDDGAFDGMRAWLDKMTEPEYGRVGYIQRGGSPARPQALIDKFPGDKSESMTAVGVFSRILLGEDPRKSAVMKKGAQLMAKLPPVWNPSDGSIDMYYWYYGTLAMFQVGGSSWKVWNKALKSAVADNQRRDTDYCMYKGSWDPIGPWGPDGGRVYATALMAMCLEVYYRYDRVFGSWRR